MKESAVYCGGKRVSRNKNDAEKSENLFHIFFCTPLLCEYALIYLNVNSKLSFWSCIFNLFHVLVL